ncbi:MAG: hypothetical protein Q9213_003697 [Squamulea squamosa]
MARELFEASAYLRPRVNLLAHIGVYHPFNDVFIETTLIILVNFLLIYFFLAALACLLVVIYERFFGTKVPAEVTGAENTGMMRSMDGSASRVHSPVQNYHDEADEEEEETDNKVDKEEAENEVYKEEADGEVYKEEAEDMVLNKEEDTEY